jgi:hypothetical protein
MDHDENLKSNIVNEHHTHTEVNGYGMTSKLEERDGKKILIFSIEKSESDFTEQEIRFFENGLRKSVSFFDPNIKKTTDRFNNNRYNSSQPRYNQKRYSQNNPHPNYRNRYGGWNEDIN